MLSLIIVIIYALFSPFIHSFISSRKREGFSLPAHTFYYVHMKGCPYCDKMKPSWDKFKKMNDTNVITKDIEKNENPAFIKKHKIESFPTLFLADKHGSKIADYEGDRTPKSFLNFIKKHV